MPKLLKYHNEVTRSCESFLGRKKVRRPIALIKANIKTGLMYRGSGYGEKRQTITAVQHALKLTLIANNNKLQRRFEENRYKLLLAKRTINPRTTPKM